MAGVAHAAARPAPVRRARPCTAAARRAQATRQGLAHHHVGIHRDDHPAVADRLAAQGQFALAVPIGFVHHQVVAAETLAGHRYAVAPQVVRGSEQAHGPTGEFSGSNRDFPAAGCESRCRSRAWAGRPRPKRCRAARGYPGVQGAGGPGRVARSRRPGVGGGQPHLAGQSVVHPAGPPQQLQGRALHLGQFEGRLAGRGQQVAGRGAQEQGRAQRRLQRRQPPAHRGLVDVKRAAAPRRVCSRQSARKTRVSSQFMAVFLMHFRISLMKSAARPRHPR